MKKIQKSVTPKKTGKVSAKPAVKPAAKKPVKTAAVPVAVSSKLPPAGDSIQAIREVFGYLRRYNHQVFVIKIEDALSPSAITTSLERRFDTGYIDSPTAREIKVAKVDTGWSMTADYEKTVPMFGNLYITLVFNKTVVIN